MKYIKTFESIDSGINQEIEENLNLLRDIFGDIDDRSKESSYTYSKRNLNQVQIFDLDRPTKTVEFNEWLHIDEYRVSFVLQVESFDELKSNVNDVISYIGRCESEGFYLEEDEPIIMFGQTHGSKMD